MNNTKTRHKLIKDIALPSAAQWMSVMNERLCAGYVSGFALFSIQGDANPIGEFDITIVLLPLLDIISFTALLYYDDTSLAFLYQASVDAFCAVNLSNKECLLCFSSMFHVIYCHFHLSSFVVASFMTWHCSRAEKIYKPTPMIMI